MVIVDSLKYLQDQLLLYIPDELLAYLPKSLVTRSLLCGTLAGLVGYWLMKKRYRLPPGPFSWPLIGNVEVFTKGSIAETFHNWSKKYGPVVSFNFGTIKCVVLNRIDVINEALLTKGADYANRLTVYSNEKMSRNGQDIILANYNNGWKLRRKVGGRALRLFMVGGSLDYKIEEAVERTVEAMLKEKEPFDPKSYMFFTTLNILAAMIFGKRYQYEDETYRNLLDILNEMAEIQSEANLIENFFPPARLFPSKKFRRLMQRFDEFIGYVDDNIARVTREFVPGTVTNVTESLLQAEKEMREEGDENMAEFKPLHVQLTVFDLFLAGNETSRQTLYWTLLYITALPEVQAKIQEELDRVVGRDRYPTTSDRSKLSYTDAVLHEAMRLGSVAPVGVPHEVGCDTTIYNGKYDIPKGTLVFINHWSIMNDPELWDDVEQFKPERFLDEDGKMGPKPENWLPFSAGRRVCLGESLAKAELHLVIASLCQRLVFKPAPGTKIDTTPENKGLLDGPRAYKIVVERRF